MRARTAPALKNKDDFNRDDIGMQETPGAIRSVKRDDPAQPQDAELLQKEMFCCNMATD